MPNTCGNDKCIHNSGWETWRNETIWEPQMNLEDSMRVWTRLIRVMVDITGMIL